MIERPFGRIHAEQFRIVESEAPPLTPGSALLENVYLLIEADARTLSAGESYLHTPVLGGAAIARVIASRTRALPVGAMVQHVTGWSTHSVVWAGQPGVRIIDVVAGLPITLHLSVFGPPGMTAWQSVHEALQLSPGEVLYVASAVRLVGSLVGQVATLTGAVQLLAGVRGENSACIATDVYGFDDVYDTLESAALGRLAGPLTGQIDAAWVDLDRDHVSVVANSLRRPGGRIVHVGQGAYADAVVRPYRPQPLGVPRETVEACLSPYLRTGELVVNETYVFGIEQIVGAFLGVLSEELTGAVIARITDI
ncbi:hypothetical protein [Streptomyces sp. NPDC002324]